MTPTPALNTGLDDFLDWAAREPGGAPPARPADAVLTLLALHGADRRAGVPEPTPRLVARLLREDLPGLLWASEEEADAVPGVLRSLAECVRQSGRLNAKRHGRLLAAVDEAAPEFRRAAADPERLTWHRWYASRLRADGTDPDDPGAVRAWLDARAGTPRARRTPLPEGVHRADVADRTFAVRALLAELLLAAFARDARDPGPAGPLLPSPPLDADRPDDALGDALERTADALTDRWTAAGLSAALAGAHADLAPGPGALPHAGLADRLLDEHLDYVGDSSVPLPPPPALPEPGTVRDLLHAAPLPAALAAGAFGDDEELREVSERCGLPGPATAVWNDGTPQELTELAADVLAAQAERMPPVTGPGEAYSFDAAHLLYSLCERGGTPDSIARKTADARSDGLPPEQEDAPAPVSGGAPAAYELPSAGELARLFGVSAVTDAERAELDLPAQGLAALVDRLAATGCVFRAGDAYGLTPLGAAALRHVLAVGRVAAPDRDTVASWDAAGTVTAARHWPTRIAAAALAAWIARRGGTDEAWGELLAAVSAAKASDPSLARARDYFARLELAGVPAAALRAALTDPVTGAAARRALLARGEQVPEDPVPLTARAVTLVEELDQCWIDDMLGQVRRAAEEGAGMPAPGDDPPDTVLPAFDAAASEWPGGGAALAAALGRADPVTAPRILTALHGRHPDRRVADAAAHAERTARRTVRDRYHRQAR
ncbi:hypothetical protein [Streptomyces genisteinicus]|uniref:Uncharacterized protein n=1 Tax=Streptomyces genisteinicus TaxID=2768068 RepID=A0A7H0I026_9ACTN|nr:hypothetical protein [Streptomyces genisteinicus]QNP66142.1 hypothetical protein IAG43_26590 [Streptomyces genisteinicus]